MKKVLSVLLALTMILAMLPTTFAAEAEAETGAITYEFSQASHAGTSNKLEARTGVPAASYTKYPENPADPGFMWAYLGTNVPSTGTKSSHYFALISEENEVPYILTALLPYDGWVAFKIYVPEKGLYDISGTAWGRTDGSAKQEMYIIPAGDELTTGKTAEETFVRTGSGDIYGTVSLNTTYDRSGALSFSELGITADYLVSTSNTYSSTLNVPVNMAEKKGIELNAGENILLLREADSSVTTASKRLSISSLTIAPARLDKTHKYVFNNTVLTGDILENDAFTENYRMFYKPEGEESYTGNYLDSYDNLNSSFTDLWAVSLFGGIFNSTSYKFTSSLGETRLQMIGRKRFNNGANTDANFVLKLNVKYDGIYAITAEVGEYINGTQADIYMFPADETITDINSEMLKNYNSIGRVSNVTGEGDGDVGTIQLTKGDWYFVFAFNSTNKSTATNSRQYFNLQSITLTETDALPESGTTPDTTENIAPLSFSATTNIPSIAAVTINGNEGNLAVINPSRGAELSVSAPEVSGYKFIGWKAGAANDTGDGELQNTAKFVNGLEQEDTFTVYTSTFLTAVYEEIAPSEDADSIVEFWNLDGSYLGQKSVTELEELAAEDKTLKTSLIGHTFTGWFTAEDVALDISTIIEKVTHAVAGYTADATLAATNDDGVRVNGETDAEANAYGKEVICVDNKGTVTHWLRDGKVVSYDETYKYYVWDSTNITSSYAPVEKKPLVVLDGETVSDAYMIEYDGAGKNIVEVGILFGSGAAPTVESKSEIFKSQRGNNHGQFAAKPSDSSYTARGYMIYEENGTYKVIYSE